MTKNSQKLKKISERPDMEAEVLLARTLNKGRAWILAHTDQILTANQEKAFALLINRRLTGEPLAYILGQQEFYGLPFKVNKNVLIPRPETEKLVDLICHCESSALSFPSRIAVWDKLRRESRPLSKPAKGWIPAYAGMTKKDIIIDIGTGSGALIISLAKNLTNEYVKFFGIDISAKALTIAKQNAKLNKVNENIKFLHGDLLKPLFTRHWKFKFGNCLDIGNWKLEIVCNLPYLKTSLSNLTKQQKKALNYEPRTALFSGPDGLNHYRRLAQQIKKIRAVYPRLLLTLYCEADPEQMAELKKILTPAQTAIIKDFRGLNRFLLAQF